MEACCLEPRITQEALERRCMSVNTTRYTTLVSRCLDVRLECGKPGFKSQPIYSIDLKVCIVVAIPSDARRYGVVSRTGWPCVSML